MKSTTIKFQHSTLNFAVISIQSIMLKILTVFYVIALFGASKSSKIQNNRPLIGIVEQILVDEDLNPRWTQEHEFKTYISAAYVKLVEGGGARAVPIW